MNDDRDNVGAHSGGVTRRMFLGGAAAAGAAMLTGGVELLESQVQGAADASTWIEKSIPELQALKSSGALTSRDLTQGYLQRIRDVNPFLRAVIETNSEAMGIAANLDAERRAGRVNCLLQSRTLGIDSNSSSRPSICE